MSRLVLVTGASRGIGRATALAFAGEGARVILDHPGDDAAVAETADLVAAAGGTPLPFAADVADPDQVAELARFAHGHGPVDVLVNNAGICPFRSLFEIDVATWDRVHAVNLRGAFLVAQAVARGMVDGGAGGRIISVASISAFTGGEQQIHYCPTKAGLTALMKSMAVALAPHRITCNSVLPGVILTDINAEDLRNEAKAASIRSRVPLGMGHPEDVAGAITLLADPRAAYITGADLVVDGGLTINPGT